jgi:hypothetical protein
MNAHRNQNRTIFFGDTGWILTVPPVYGAPFLARRLQWFWAELRGDRGHHVMSLQKGFVLCDILQPYFSASVAQLDRASDFGSEGYRFKSCRTRQFP